MAIQNCYKCLKPILPSDEQHYGLHSKPCFQTWFQSALDQFNMESLPLPKFKSLMLKSSQTENHDRILSSNFQGRYKKYTAILGARHYILKVQEEEYPELPQTEYLCNQIGDLLGISVPKYYLLKIEENGNNLICFVVENFMSEMPGSNLKHIYHYLKSIPEDFSCREILNVIQENSIRKNDDTKLFIEVCLFDSLIGNHDRHGKNLGFIETSKGKYLAPIYDNPSYIGIEEVFLSSDLEPKGKIATSKTVNPSMKEYIDEFNSMGYQKNILNFKNKINLSEIYNLIDLSFISTIRKNAFRRLIQKRYGELMNVK